MKFFKFILLFLLAGISFLAGLLSVSCAGHEANSMPAANLAPNPLPISFSSESNSEKINDLLDEIAELERSGVFRQGMGFIEAGLREKNGDFSGAVFAAYKELSYSYSQGEMSKEDIMSALLRIVDSEDFFGKESASQAALAIMAYFNERWDEAEEKLAEIITELDEPDSFPHWMLLSCYLEKKTEDRKTLNLYKVIRARYSQYPEYWYRGARAFSGNIAMEYAECCINLAPSGPFAGECRNLLAVHSGLKEEAGFLFKSKTEVEEIIFKAVSTSKPELLEPLLLLMDLPENPFTIYVLNSLKNLASDPLFNDYFNSCAASSKGRLLDRLLYICRS